MTSLLTYLFTGDVSLIVVSGDRIFFRSHTLTVLSSLPETTLSPLANVADVTGLELKHKITNEWEEI